MVVGTGSTAYGKGSLLSMSTGSCGAMIMRLGSSLIS